MKRYNVDVQKN